MIDMMSQQNPDNQPNDHDHPDGDIWLNPQLVIQYLSKGDEITFRFFADDGSQDTPTPSGDLITKTATVTKAVEGAVGGIFADPNPSADSTPTYKLHLIEGGTVTGTHRYGSRSVRHGLRAKVRLTEDMI